MNVDVTTIRWALAALVSEALDAAGKAATVYADGAIDGAPVLPAVVVGNPRWEPGDGPAACWARWSWPVAVLVARDGSSDPAANRELEQLWPVLAAHLDKRVRKIPGVTGRVDSAAHLEIVADL